MRQVRRVGQIAFLARRRFLDLDVRHEFDGARGHLPWLSKDDRVFHDRLPRERVALTAQPLGHMQSRRMK